jgi:hypothetical protein
MPYIQKLTAIKRYIFDFSRDFAPSATIAVISTSVSPAGPVELLSQRVTLGLQVTVSVDAGSCAALALYTIECTATDSLGNRAVQSYEFLAVADPTGSTPLPPSTAMVGFYSCLMNQAGTADPTVTVLAPKLVKGNPVWTRYAEGRVRAFLLGGFPAGKTRIITTLVPGKVGNESKSSGEWIDENTIEAAVRDFGDNLVDGFQSLGVDIFTYQ